VLHPRLRLTVTVVIACCTAAILAVVVASGNSSGGGAQVTIQHGFAGALRPAGIPPADFTLPDQDGRPAALAAYRGRPVIVTFMYSTCKDTCPLMADQIRGALDALGHDVPTLVVSVDPAGDTPLNAKRFLARHGLTGRARFLLGTRAQLAPVWKAFAIQPQKGNLEHTSHTVLADRNGFQRIGFPFDRLTDEALAHDLARL
jgi:protein SCO1